MIFVLLRPKLTYCSINDFIFNLSEAELASLKEQTEGWAAGLRLLGSTLTSVSATEDRSRLINLPVQTRRHIFELLAEEVLNQQPPIVRKFLLETSILAELTPEVCQKATEQRNARELLETIYQRNLFLIALPSEDLANDTTYRYHSLFVDFLQHQFSLEDPKRMVEIHLRVATILDNPSQKIHHYIAAEAWDDAADLIEPIGIEQIENNFIQQKMISWLRKLPEFSF